MNTGINSEQLNYLMDKQLYRHLQKEKKRETKRKDKKGQIMKTASYSIIAYRRKCGHQIVHGCALEVLSSILIQNLEQR